MFINFSGIQLNDRNFHEEAIKLGINKAYPKEIKPGSKVASLWDQWHVTCAESEDTIQSQPLDLSCQKKREI